VLYVNATKQHAAIYDPPKVRELCSLNVKRKSVTFRSGQVMDWPSGLRYALVFKGSLGPNGLRGDLLVVGGAYDGQVSPTELAFYPVDTALDFPDTSRQGVYANVRAGLGTRDLLGDELILLKNRGRLVALWTDFEGAPNGPYLADSVTQHGDTTRIDGTWGLVDRPWAFSRVFLLNSGAPGPHPDTSQSTSVARPTWLRKVDDLAGFFGPSNTILCSDTEREKQGAE
jgi:hypothetical protein